MWGFPLTALPHPQPASQNSLLPCARSRGAREKSWRTLAHALPFAPEVL